MAFQALVLISTCLFVAVAGQQNCASVQCPRMPTHYMEMGCTPVIAPGACCPERFDCSHLAGRDPTKCYIGGAVFKSRDAIADSVVKHDCSTGCSCRQAGDKTKVMCANIECPEFLGPRPDPNCVLQYKVDDCCSYKTVCDEKEKAKLATCQLDGKSYREGERMYPKSNKCKKCVCGKGFTGQLVEPFCKTFSCGIEVHYTEKLRKGCVPTYYGTDGCCPIAWRCPDQADNVVASKTKKSSSDPAMRCSFGNLTMNLGDSLSPDGEICTTCTCAAPPMASCVKDPVCYEKTIPSH